MTSMERHRRHLGVEEIPEALEEIELFPGVNDLTIIPWIVVGCIVFYVVLLALAIWLDYKRILKRPRLVVMADVTKFYTEQFYAISLETGNTMLASSSANICCQLYGQKGRSQVYVLKDSILDSAKHGDIITILISSPKDLGKLEMIRVWHDNTGFYPSWFCRKIVVRNLKTEALWCFLINGWLSILGNGKNRKPTVIFTCPVATTAEVIAFTRNRFSLRTYWHKMLEHHGWTSFFTCAPYTTFPRMERLTCAMVLLTSTMILLMTEYGFVSAKSNSSYEFREANFWDGLWRGVVAGLPATVVGLIVGLLFRRIHRRRVPALILRGEEDKYKEDVLATKPVVEKTKSKYVFGIERNQEQGDINTHLHVTPIKSEEVLEIEDDGEDAAAPELEENVFRIPSTDILQTENWISRALPRYSRNYNPMHLVRKCPESGGGADESDFDFDRYEIPNLEAQRPSASKPGDRSIYHPADVPAVSNTSRERLGSSSRPSSPVRSAGDFLVPAAEEIAKPVAPSKADKTRKALENMNQEFALCEIPVNSDKLFHLPHYFLPIVWILSLSIIVISCVFTILHGYKYGYVRSLDWTFSLVVGILTSVCIWEPIVVLVKYLCEIHLITKGLRMSRDELIRKTRFVLIGTNDVRRKFHKIWPLNYLLYLDWMKNAFPPLTGSKIFAWNVDARRKLKARKGVLDVVVFLVYLLILIFIMSITRTQKNWQNTRVFEEMLLLGHEPHVLEHPHAFHNIKKITELYHYMDQVFVPALHSEDDFSGNPIRIANETHAHHRPDIWLSNRNAFLLGVPRIRQLRVVPGAPNCEREKMFSDYLYSCDRDLSEEFQPENLETSDFSEGWIKLEGGNRTTSTTNNYWKYHGKETHGGADHGYIAELGRTVERSHNVTRRLKHHYWIDSYTREIFIEFNAYNPNVNLYTLVSLKMRLTPTMTFVSSFELTSTRFIGGFGGADISFRETAFFFLGCVYVFCCAYLLYNSATGIIDHYNYHGFKALFQNKMILLDTTIPIIGIAIIVNFIILYQTVVTTLKSIREDKVYKFVSFSMIQVRNEAQIMLYCASMIGCLIKLWSLLVVSSRRFFIIGFTLGHVKHLLFGSILMYFILVIAFAICTTINFGSINEYYSTFGRSVLILIYQTATGVAVRYYDWEKAEPILGPLLYSSFNVIVKFLVLNVLISTLTMGLQEAKEVSIQRPFRLSYTGFILLKIQSFLPLCMRKIFATKEAIVTISERKERELEEAFMQILSNHITSIEVQRMREMKDITEDLVADTGQILISKKDKMTAKKNKMRKIGESRLNRMRELTIRYVKKCAALEFNAKDKAKYDEFNKAILDIRCDKLLGKMRRLEEKYEAQFPNQFQILYNTRESVEEWRPN